MKHIKESSSSFSFEPSQFSPLIQPATIENYSAPIESIFSGTSTLNSEPNLPDSNACESLLEINLNKNTISYPFYRNTRLTSESNCTTFFNDVNYDNLNSNRKNFKSHSSAATTTITAAELCSFNSKLNDLSLPFVANRRNSKKAKRPFFLNIRFCLCNLRLFKWLSKQLDVEDRAKRADYISSNNFLINKVLSRLSCINII